MVIILFNEQPRVGVFAPAPARANQHPSTLQLDSMQRELDLAGTVGLGGVGLGSPDAPIPDDHLARAILACRNRSFKFVVGDRVVFDMHRHTLHFRIKAGPFGHRPALHGAVDLNTKIVVQSPRPMFLNHELQG